VLFSNAGTLAKFDRMGVVAGFAPPSHKYHRVGLAYDADPNAVVGTSFSKDVSSVDYEEHWSDELQIFHNPKAKHPFAEGAFGGITQHFFTDGEPRTVSFGGVIASWTLIVKLIDEQNEGREAFPSQSAATNKRRDLL
jgi:hypothetical protein